MGTNLTPNLSIPIVDQYDHVARESINNAIEVIDKNALHKKHADSPAHWETWKAGTEYSVRDVFRTEGLPSWGYFEVTKAGTSDSDEKNEPTSSSEGEVITDGTCEIVLRRLVSRIDTLQFYDGKAITSDAIITRSDLPRGTSVVEVFDGEKTTYPTSTGGSIRIFGSSGVGVCELLCGYYGEGEQGRAHLYYRNMSNSGNVWSDWDRILFSGEEKTIHEWTANTEYIVDDIARRGNKLFVCTTANSDSTFTKSNWMQLDGLDANIPNWLANHTYAKNEVVIYEEKLYRANKSHTSTTQFSLDLENWDSVKGADPYLLDWNDYHNYKTGEVVVVENKLYRANKDHRAGMTFLADIESWDLIEGADPYIPSWEADHSYAKDEVVVSDSVLYRATIKHTSGTSLKDDISNWEKVGSLDPYAPDWQAEHNYKVNEIVVSGKKLYRATAKHQSTTDIQTDIANWEIIEGTDPYIPSWQADHAYKQNEVVADNSKLYRAKVDHTSTIDLKTDISKWEQVSGFDVKIVDWQADHAYNANEVVVSKHKLYRAKTSHTSTTSITADIASWEQLEGLDTYVPDLEENHGYKVNEVVICKGKMYRAKNDHLSSTDVITDDDNWELIEGATPYAPNWTAKQAYKVGEIVVQDSKLYRAKTDHSAAEEFKEDLSAWELLSGADPYIPDWQATHDYEKDEVVVSNKRIYRALAKHTSSETFTEDTKKWEKLGGSVGGVSEWTAKVDYEAGQLVTYGGIYYKALSDHTSSEAFTTDLAQWEPVTANVNEWAQKVYYPKNFIVRSEDTLYRCTAAHYSTTSIIADIASWKAIGSTSSGVGEWTAKTFYSAGQMVLKGTSLYKAVERHISSETFVGDAAKWQIICASIALWGADSYYPADTTIIVENQIYKCKTAHTSSETFKEDVDNWELMVGTDPYTPDWQSNHEYKANEVVASNSRLYRAKTAHTSTTDITTDIANWEELAKDDFLIKEWATDTEYLVGQPMTYNGLLFKAKTKHTSSSNYVADVAKWELVGGYIGEWQGGICYPEGVYVTNNKNLYRCTTRHIASTNFANDTANWQEIAKDSFVIAEWTTSTKYNAGALALYDNLLYRAKSEHTSGSTFTSDISSWDLVTATLNAWTASTFYPKSTVIINGNKLYQCTSQHTSSSDFTADTANWQCLTSGTVEDWKANTTYAIGTLCVYDLKLYRCKTEHTSSSSLTNSEISTNWELVGGGSGGIEAWESSKAYGVGDLVLYKDTIYKCRTEHTSTSDFSADYSSYWTMIDQKSCAAGTGDAFYNNNELILNTAAGLRYSTGNYKRPTTADEYKARQKPVSASIAQFSKYVNHLEGETALVDNKRLYVCTTNESLTSADWGIEDKTIYSNTNQITINVATSAGSLTYKGETVLTLSDYYYVTNINIGYWAIGGSMGKSNYAEVYVSTDGTNYEFAGQTSIYLSIGSFVLPNMRCKYIKIVIYAVYAQASDYKANGKGYINKITVTGKSANWSQIKDGRVLDWDSSNTYLPKELVVKDRKLYRKLVAQSNSFGTVGVPVKHSIWETLIGDIDHWKTSTFYTVDSTVIYNHQLYECLTQHTSSTDFDKDKSYWQKVGGDVSASNIATPAQVLAAMTEEITDETSES